MKLGTTIRIAALILGGTAFFAACSSKSSGTDSSTHWLETCKSDADCGSLSCECGICTKPCTEPADCSELSSRAVCREAPDCTSGAKVCLRTSTIPLEGGPCPDGAVGNEPCDGRIAQCWTPCVQGLRGQLVCDGGKWLAGHGLFPCGPDGGVEGAGGSGAGGAGAGGANQAGSSGRGQAGAGGAAGSGAGGVDAGAVSSACNGSEDCALVPTVCCPLCRPAMLSERIGIKASAVSAYLDAKCANAGACPPCIPSDGTIQAVCNDSKCEAVDVAPYAACTTAMDCTIVPKDCCACGTLRTPAWTAVSDVDGYQKKCDTVRCPPCTGGVHQFSTDYAICTEGVCGLVSGA